ncbi:MAG: aldehyde dehydrogenase [Thauera sp.]|jgi:acyl-CoA reductase-like NAD-dependent aldehyde dehydrogenase|nr:aldehyde dehydrogenase [Thauera sp.]
MSSYPICRGADDAVAIANKAAAALPAWAALGPGARRAFLERAADALEAKVDDFIAAMSEETGATELWARMNVVRAAGVVREAAAITTQIAGEVIPSDKPGSMAMAVREPAGVVLGIAPWNAPIVLGVRAIAVPLACGNTAILKASDVCPRTHALITAAFQEAGLAAGVVNLVAHQPADAAEVVGALIDHPAVRRINFTGSTSVGRMIAERAARNLKPVLLELGGKAPMLVLEDADLDEAVKAAAFGAFLNQGQICVSTERILVVDAVADAFIEKLVAKASALSAGNPREGKTPLGGVVDAKSANRIRELIADALAKGATRLAGTDGEGVLIPANVVDRIDSSMRLYREESFGPVVGVVRVRDADHAVSVANDTEYGLSAAVFTRDIIRGLSVAKRIKSGICHINGPTVHDEPQMPFGGVGDSGYGRFGGKAGIEAFTELRWITIQMQPSSYPI